MAAGCAFRHEDFQALRHRLTVDVLQHVEPAALIPTLTGECVLDIDDVTMELLDALSTLEPFGQGNPEPRFLLPHVSLGCARKIGSDGTHLQGCIGNMRAVGFGLGALLPSAAQPLDLVCRLGINEWQGRCTPQMYIEDMREANVMVSPTNHDI